MKYIFSLAGLSYEIEVPIKLNISDKHMSFLWEESFDNGFGHNEEDNLQGRVVIEFTESLPYVPEHAIIEQYRFYSPEEDNQSWFSNSPDGKPYAYSDRRRAPDYIHIQVLPSMDSDLRITNVLMILLEIETILCFNNGLMMHGCTIQMQDGGLIFTGPSGVGKSTQGKLWESYAGATVLNGDRAGLMQDDGIWKSWGLPFAGSSAIYINRGTPLRGIILLEQASENRLLRLSMKEAFSALYPQTHLHKWSPSFMSRGTENLIRLLSSVPVYRLVCRPDEEAVRIVQREIFGGIGYVSSESDI